MRKTIIMRKEQIIYMFKVVKRDGEVADFDLQKIGCAIEKAFDATQMSYNDDIIGLLSAEFASDC